jgi:hypothetical protein
LKPREFGPIGARILEFVREVGDKTLTTWSTAISPFYLCISTLQPKVSIVIWEANLPQKHTSSGGAENVERYSRDKLP